MVTTRVSKCGNGIFMIDCKPQFAIRVQNMLKATGFEIIQTVRYINKYYDSGVEIYYRRIKWQAK